jgi:hypothetical protein
MEKRKVTSEGFFRILLILTGAMIMSQVSMVGAFIYLAIMGELLPDPAAAAIMVYVLPIVACTSFGASFFLPNMLMAKAADKPTLAEKMRGYQTAFMIRLILVELPAILACVTFYLSSEYYWLTVNAISILLLAMAFPSRQKAIDALRLSGPEVALVNDPKAVLMENTVSSAD